MEIKIKPQIGISIIIFLSLCLLGYIFFQKAQITQKINSVLLPVFQKQKNLSQLKIQKFVSIEDFQKYLQESQETFLNFSENIAIKEEGTLPSKAESLQKESQSEIERVSETNVQESGIDEMDIVKTNGKEIYYSPGYFYFPFIRENIRVGEKYPQSSQNKIKVINAFPPEDLKLLSDISQNGEFLLVKNTLVVISNNEILGYDVENPQTPKEIWKKEFDPKNSLISARLYQDKIYLALKTNLNYYQPCPVKVFSNDSLTIECTDIYHPIEVTQIDSIFNVLILNPQTGKVEKNLSFVGSSGSSILYMSRNSIFLTFLERNSNFSLLADFLVNQAQDLLPNEIFQRIAKIKDYEISDYSKIYEFQIIYQNYLNSLEREESIRIQNEINNRFSEYFKLHKRDFVKTKIVKIDLDKFEIQAQNDIPGTLLNQFSLSEDRGYLRVATTISGRSPFYFIFTNEEETNDFSILDENLKIVSKIQDFGLGERIYAVRFIGNLGYIVTFKETDPLFILNLSDIKNPKIEGELKVSGYSSYLHMLSDKIILGIGKEENKVKISLFNIESPKEPKEISRYVLDEYWSEILNNHHAFLIDPKNQLFFLPTGNKGYIFSFKEGKLYLEKVVSMNTIKRAVFINDYLYILGDKIFVFDEKTMQKIKELSLD